MLKKREHKEGADESPANSDYEDVMYDKDADDDNEDADEGECQECRFPVLSSNPDDHQFCSPVEAGDSDEKDDTKAAVWPCYICEFMAHT